VKRHITTSQCSARSKTCCCWNSIPLPFIWIYLFFLCFWFCLRLNVSNPSCLVYNSLILELIQQHFSVVACPSIDNEVVPVSFRAARRSFANFCVFVVVFFNVIFFCLILLHYAPHPHSRASNLFTTTAKWYPPWPLCSVTLTTRLSFPKTRVSYASSCRSRIVLSNTLRYRL